MTHGHDGGHRRPSHHHPAVPRHGGRGHDDAEILARIPVVEAEVAKLPAGPGVDRTNTEFELAALGKELKKRKIVVDVNCSSISDTGGAASPPEDEVWLSLRNLRDRPLAVQFAVESPGGRRDHDALSARLVSPDGERTLRFTGARNVSASGVAELAAGAAAADALDVAAWALAEINGGTPLAPGDHELTATYRPDIPGAWSGTIGAGPVALRVP